MSSDPKKKGLRGKPVDNFCVLECHKNYTTEERNGVQYCKPCEGIYFLNVFQCQNNVWNYMYIWLNI